MNALKNCAGLLAAGMIASGCVVDVTFEPIGGDVSVAGSWTINGGLADATSCNAADIATVQLFVCDAIDGDCYDGADISAPCSQGNFNTGPLLVPDTYALQWAAYNSAGTEVGRGGWETVTAFGGDTISSNVNFETTVIPADVTLDATWLINGAAADATSCNAAGVATVRLTAFNDAAGTDTFQSWDIPCANGFIDSRSNVGDPSLPSGTFYTQWFAVDGSGTILAQTDAPLLLDTTATAHATLATPDFGVVTINTLDVTLLYESRIDGSYGDCTASVVDGANQFGYQLRTMGGTPITMEFGLPSCANGLTFDDVASDIYVLEVTAAAADGTKWGGAFAPCEGLVVDAGLEEYDCEIPLE